MSNTASILTQEALLAIGWDGRPAPRLAEEWEWIQRGSALKLKLHDSIKFHDGTPIDAVLARDALRNGIKRAFLSPDSHVSLGSITDIEVIDPRTLILRLREPEAFLPLDLAALPLTHPSNAEVGAGAYERIVDTAEGDGRPPDVIRLKSFKDYYRGKPVIPDVELRRYEEHRTAYAELLRGGIDAIHEVTPTVLDFVEAQSTVKTFSFTRAYFWQMFFNLRHPALRHTSVRLAMSQAVDRQALVDGVFKGRGVPADTPIWPMHWAYTSPPKTVTSNLEAATLRLEGAGFKIVKRPGSMPSRFRFTCVTIANDARYERLASLLQKQFEEINVDMQVEALPFRTLQERIGRGQFDAILLERASFRSLAWTYLTYHSSMMPFGYTSADAVLDRLRRSLSDQDTRAALNELQTILRDDPPAVFMMWPITVRAVSTRFQVPGESGRDILGTLWQWRPTSPTP
jgi:peptide/nickel transport system substrate-binding protein